jgi:hypothetical protein
VHIISTDLLTCTFSEDDWRYHARAIICGTPTIISTTGIIEAPAKPREFYFPSCGFSAKIDNNSDWSKREVKGSRFIDYQDRRMSQVVVGYIMQALFFFISNGEPFCDNDACRLYNSHWQEDLIRTQVKSPMLCPKHASILKEFVYRQG